MEFYRLRKNKILWLLLAAFYNFLIYSGSRMIAVNHSHYSMQTMLDAKIPLIPEMILVYWGCYLFWIMNYYLSAKYDKGNGYKFIRAHFIGETACFFFFIFFPTMMIRPEITGFDFCSRALKMTYLIDRADNLFPSIHCFVSWLCWIGVRNNTKIPVWYQKLSLLMAIAVCISTVTVKQHVIVDVIAGILLAEISYRSV